MQEASKTFEGKTEERERKEEGEAAERREGDERRKGRTTGKEVLRDADCICFMRLWKSLSFLWAASSKCFS